MKEQAIWSEKLPESDFDLWTVAKAGQKYDSWPWPEKRNFIEMYSACRNQQGNGDKAEK